MKLNRILARIKEGRRATGCQLSFPSTTLVEVMGIAGLDFVVVDGEHGTFSWESVDDISHSRHSDDENSLDFHGVDSAHVHLEGPEDSPFCEPHRERISRIISLVE